MKKGKSLILSIFLLLYIINLYGQDSIKLNTIQLNSKDLIQKITIKEYGNNYTSIYFANLKDSLLLKTFYDNSEYRDSEVVWTPNFNELNLFENVISDDNLCHTKIDTILQISEKEYLVSFSTISYHKHNIDKAHSSRPIIGIASFSKEEQGYKFFNFKKYVFHEGQWGNGVKIEFENFGKNEFIKIKVEYTGTGAVSDYVMYYNLKTFNFIKSFLLFESNGGGPETSYNLEETFTTITNKKEDKFDVIKIVKYFDKNNQLKKKIRKVKHYEYNQEEERFE